MFNKRIAKVFSIVVITSMVTLMVEWIFFRQQPVQVPLIMSNLSAPSPLTPPAPRELESHIRVNPCIDLYDYVCSLVHAEDPTGEVRRDSEGEVDVLRIYENIIRTHKRISLEKADELLVKQIYTPERVKQIRELFEKARAGLLQFIDIQPFQTLKDSEKEILRKRIQRVKLELPPPASVYADEPDLFTRNDVYYERAPNREIRIRMGGALFFTVNSQFNLAFTLSHELAHAIDPCELRADHVDILAYHGLAECFGMPTSGSGGGLDEECSPKGKLSEIFADWAATHVVAKILAESAPKFSSEQLKSAVYNTVRDLCREEEEVFEDTEEGLSSSHPTVTYRVNRIFAQHPQIRKFLGCHDVAGPQLPSVPSYCFFAK